MSKEYIFLFKAIFFGCAALILIPKVQYRKFVIYGFFLGAVSDVLIVTVISGFFHWFRYQNMGVFSVMGLFAFWSPLAWMGWWGAYRAVWREEKVWLSSVFASGTMIPASYFIVSKVNQTARSSETDWLIFRKTKLIMHTDDPETNSAESSMDSAGLGNE